MLFDNAAIRKFGFHVAATVAMFFITPTAVRAQRKDAGSTSPHGQIDFARDIRPLLSNACYACHGPDEGNRQADLRLDSLTDAAGDLGGYAAIVPGNREDSEVWTRITSDDPGMVMPPPGSGKHLSPAEHELIGRWIDAGAQSVDHWAFAKPRRYDPPAVAELNQTSFSAWNDSAIDRFVARKILDAGMQPSLAADQRSLLRRLSLDLIGLPPTIEEIDAFINDDSPRAYERQVQRLLASDHFGERWGRMWLDSARYADSDGYEKDKPRSVHFYRDWVARAFTEDMPYDQFVIKQIAGDLLPNPTQDDLVATGFLRNSMHNEEAGTDPEQFRMEAMYDRVDAIGKSVLGLTVQCAQCHTHKYDPITHTDYYALFAMLNNFHESSITVYTPDEQRQRNDIAAKISSVYDEVLASNPGVASEFATFVQQQRGVAAQDFQTLDLDWIEETTSGQKYTLQDDGSFLQQAHAASRNASTADIGNLQPLAIRSVRFEVMRDPNLPHGGPGRSFDGTWALSEFRLLVEDVDGSFHPVALEIAGASIDPPRRRLEPRYWFQEPNPDRVTGPSAYAVDGDENTAWTGTLSPGRRNDPQVAYFKLAEPIVVNGDHTPRMQVEVAMRHGGWNSDDNQSHNIGRFRIGVSDRADGFDTLPPRLRNAASTDARRDEWMAEFFRRRDDALATDLRQRIDALWAQSPAGVGQLVVAERTKPRETHRLERGSFLTPAEVVQGNTPGFLHPLPDGATGNRLDLAYWLVDRESPTTARSIVNRIWQEYFGVGLTATADDFGLQGEPPVNASLLDYLAVELMTHDWSLKSLHRSIVMSQAYRQSSCVSEVAQQHDPDNRLLARGARVRVPAEMVRDIALTASGLLDRTIGGSPAYPTAPDFLFVPPTSYGPKTWGRDDASATDEYRRGYYTFRFRSVPYPAYQVFDAPTGEVSCVRRSVSNTPLQALVLLNEPLFMRCAANLADEILVAETDDAARIRMLYRRSLGRDAAVHERDVVKAFLQDQQQRFSRDRSLANELVSHSVVESPVETIERASWIALARVVLSLDETITKE